MYSQIEATVTRDRISTDPLGSDPLWYGTGSKLKRYGSIWDRLHEWTSGVDSFGTK